MGSSMDVQESEFFRIASGDLVEVVMCIPVKHIHEIGDTVRE